MTIENINYDLPIKYFVNLLKLSLQMNGTVVFRDKVKGELRIEKIEDDYILTPESSKLTTSMSVL